LIDEDSETESRSDGQGCPRNRSREKCRLAKEVSEGWAAGIPWLRRWAVVTVHPVWQAAVDPKRELGAKNSFVMSNSFERMYMTFA
jgi:hypothetical protein